MNAHYVPLIMCSSGRLMTGNKTKYELRRGGVRRELQKGGRGMKGSVDKSMGIVTLIPETLAKIKPTEPLILAKRAARKKRNCFLR